MQFKLLDGSTVDTDKMSDSEAEITEKANQLLELSIKYDRPLLVLSGNVRGLCFHHFATKDVTPYEEYLNRVNVFAATMGRLLFQMTGGQLYVAKNPNFQPPA